MFTGLVEEIGTITRIERVPHGSLLRIATSAVAPSLAIGDSVAVDGVCLTAVEIDGTDFATEVSPETIARTNQSFYEEGTRVNLERPLAANARFGGHFVQGHVDAVTRQRFQREEGDFVRIRFEMPVGLERYLVPKGSIAINGVSLTIADLDEDWFDVQLVPHTLEHTNLVSDKRAEAMNVEVDILGKYVARMLEGHPQVPAVESIVAIAGDEK
ncbi:MAG: riboflavin synthase [Acidobacteria bacterium]|nr:riboflavin synthase [Acidobacteriota bacterium]